MTITGLLKARMKDSTEDIICIQFRALEIESWAIDFTTFVKCGAPFVNRAESSERTEL